jgi:hypothetical protein
MCHPEIRRPWTALPERCFAGNLPSAFFGNPRQGSATSDKGHALFSASDRVIIKNATARQNAAGPWYAGKLPQSCVADDLSSACPVIIGNDEQHNAVTLLPSYPILRYTKFRQTGILKNDH